MAVAKFSLFTLESKLKFQFDNNLSDKQESLLRPIGINMRYLFHCHRNQFAIETDSETGLVRLNVVTDLKLGRYI